MRSQEETDFLNSLLPLNSRYYWTGIRKDGKDWIFDGSNIKVPEDAQNWAPQEPDTIAGQDCVEVYIKREKDTAKWNNENCRKKKGTVCYTGKSDDFAHVFFFFFFCETQNMFNIWFFSVHMQPLVHRTPAVKMQSVWRR